MVPKGTFTKRGTKNIWLDMRKNTKQKDIQRTNFKKRGAVMFFFHSMCNELTFLCFNFTTKPPAYLQKLDKHPTAKVGHLDIVSFPGITYKAKDRF